MGKLMLDWVTLLSIWRFFLNNNWSYKKWWDLPWIILGRRKGYSTSGSSARSWNACYITEFECNPGFYGHPSILSREVTYKRTTFQLLCSKRPTVVSTCEGAKTIVKVRDVWTKLVSMRIERQVLSSSEVPSLIPGDQLEKGVVKGKG
jgi:hypothetical protein